MISTRHAINPQIQAISGRTSRYEQPVSSFTRPAMQPVEAMSRPQQTTPTQAVPTRQPLGAPSTLSAMAAGISGGGPAQAQPIGTGYTPANDFEVEVNKAVFGSGTGFVRDRAVSGIVNAALAQLAGAPGEAVLEAGIHGTIPGLGSLASLTADLATKSVARNQIMDAYGPHMQDFSMEAYDKYQEAAPFERVGDEMAVGGTVSVPGGISVEDRAMYGLRDMMVEDAANRTRNPLSQFASEFVVGPITGKPRTTIFDPVNVSQELLRRLHTGTSAPNDGVVDRDLERTFASMMDEGTIRDYADYGIDVRSELPYSPIDPDTMDPLGVAVPSKEYTDELDAKFRDEFGDVFGGGGDSGSSSGIGSMGGGRAASDADMSGDTDAGGLGGFGMW